jgi:hypothetical protein
MATDCGVDCAEGSAGVFELEATAEFSAALSCFHQANLGADWQPTTADKAATRGNDRSTVRFMTLAAQDAFDGTLATQKDCGFRRGGATVGLFGIAGLYRLRKRVLAC